MTIYGDDKLFLTNSFQMVRDGWFCKVVSGFLLLLLLFFFFFFPLIQKNTEMHTGPCQHGCMLLGQDAA